MVPCTPGSTGRPVTGASTHDQCSPEAPSSARGVWPGSSLGVCLRSAIQIQGLPSFPSPPKTPANKCGCSLYKFQPCVKAPELFPHPPPKLNSNLIWKIILSKLYNFFLYNFSVNHALKIKIASVKDIYEISENSYVQWYQILFLPFVHKSPLAFLCFRCKSCEWLILHMEVTTMYRWVTLEPKLPHSLSYLSFP